jgi:hypothetical protein
MHGNASQVPERCATIRSAVSNGSKLLDGVDGRSVTARRYRDLVADLVQQHGGKQALSPPDLALIRHLATITLRQEQFQAAVVLGKIIDDDKLIRLGSEARRIRASLERRVRRQAPPDPLTITIAPPPQAAPRAEDRAYGPGKANVGPRSDEGGSPP